MIRLFFLIRSLERGGAERQLIELVKGLDKTQFAITVATFYDGGTLRPEIEGIKQVHVLSLFKKGRWDVLPFLWRLARAVRAARPHIVHGYKPGANELSLLAGRLLGARVVWGLRASNVDFSHYNWLTAWNFRAGAWLSRFANLIIVNSNAGKRHHIAQGYCGRRMTVIPNGVDTERFQRNDAARRLRDEWGILEAESLVGLVGRLDPMKDHPTFLRAAALLAKERPGVRFVCVGDGPASYRRELQALAEELGLRENLRWAGAHSDMPAVYNALDIVTSSSSYGEGFSNVIGEAMACGVLCVVTDVGDSAAVVGNAGRVVPPKDAAALAAAWTEILEMPDEERSMLSQLSRQRIVAEYSVQHLICKTEATLLSLLR